MNPQVAYRKPRDPGYIGGYYWPPSIAGFAGLLITNVLATQYVAHHFEYQEALGAELFNLGGLHFYPPYKWIIWLFHLSDSPDIRVKLPLLLSSGIIVAGAFASGALFFLLNLAHTKSLSRNTEDLHGSAGWATKEEIDTTSLLRSKPGVYVGGWYEKATKHLHYLKHDGPEHILAFAPTRSGKGAGLVIPTLLAWPESIVGMTSRVRTGRGRQDSATRPGTCASSSLPFSLTPHASILYRKSDYSMTATFPMRRISRR